MKKTHIVTILNVAGVLSSTASGVYATVKASRIVRQKEEEQHFELTKREIIKETWKCYIPTAILTTSTVIGIVGNQKLNDKTQASLMGACAILSEAYQKYRDGSIEAFGEDADRKIIEKMREKEEAYPDDICKSKHRIKEEDAVLGYDFFTDRYFETSYWVFNKAVGSILADIYKKNVTVNDFYRYLKIPPIPGGDEIGWEEGDNPCIEYYVEYMDDGLERPEVECIVVNYHKPPIKL